MLTSRLWGLQVSLLLRGWSNRLRLLYLLLLLLLLILVRLKLGGKLLLWIKRVWLRAV
jgi:lysylphosphatidylglycerol synthetase-like protein (DUF2156 family)